MQNNITLNDYIHLKRKENKKIQLLPKEKIQIGTKSLYSEKKNKIFCMECWNKKFHLSPRTEKISITNSSYCFS